ncbi:hypothetical protein [Paenibacillus amylolyticus]|uniref:hypothetical protein n=1 Tax=Paenibacillus amylolyticus TaxID=1451 RepID=UPI00096C0CD1|nr:hypothetical protein [Paenibacillus amylolyticus]OMF47729.1 hypothetical protein BK136_02220 [Paenibacillus amylolyticus]
MASNNDLMLLELAVWEASMEQAAINLEHAEKFDDRGAIRWEKEQIRWARIKIAEIEDYLDIQKGA